MKLLAWCNVHHKVFRSFIFILSLFPGIYLIFNYYTQKIGINPFESLISVTGKSGIIFIVITLAVTPLRRWFRFVSATLALSYGKRLSDWNFLVRSRRMLGLYGFFYGSVHLLVYLYFEMDFDWNEVIYDISTRYFLWFGVATWIFLFALAITSPSWIQKKMGKYWRQLHRLTYFLSILVLFHVWLEAKIIGFEQLIYAGVILLFLSHRVLVVLIRRWHRIEDTGMLAKR